MKMYRVLPIILIALFIISCTKSSGPQGPPGATGAAGATGPVGPAGANGSIIYSGSGTPAASLGAAGDFYLDLATGLLYGPKTSAGWGTGFSLKGGTGATGSAGAPGPRGAPGATGATGAAGSQIYSGTTVPASTLGKVGDYYLNTTTYLLYGPKTASGWGSPIALQGPQGAQGPPGPEGNANVQTEVFSVQGTQWTSPIGSISAYAYYPMSIAGGYVTNYGIQYFVQPFSAITQGVLDSGMVLAYFIPSTYVLPDPWAPLPFQFLDGSYNFYYNFVAIPSVGNIDVGFFFTPNGVTGSMPNIGTYTMTALDVYTFKVVTVTGTLVTDMIREHVDLHNYNAVSRITGLWQQEKGASNL